ncbi:MULTISPECIES: HlyD family efflux transporter periplasmic adaptor subunit [unclassified Mesorhizobium]|uniref:HlyD family secretion protein n=1 Tax=unclassified Mesorhizobium TaxID=325217 RepID=UPI000FD99C57|nr:MULTISPECIES: HlyD family efflux transporter periplasmic adaptor subunit [unclassified Mesorhizobium]TGR42852.1 HlyD family efflux transporter periplasmic adaptor subunit [bacterium M00.F.Ca.ET.199.01.1.1]TGU17570.1 HlyD family efflux transporter periplasmic adaptor subunit [bacterium M00.F.Ca.ET.156.01.1.1]TGV84705.1 HlyD family efflux transporter periplasmic adaptor subunit [Mesorhizobium sp. M00.F.Ca.ET.149.01.1.1]TGR16827.1 HlyD family efflux transporter periplasmic adaptor subunit [Meso
MSFLCSLPLATQLFGACAPAAPLAVGYVEGEYVLLAPIEVAQVETVTVKRGDRVTAGATVVTLENADAKIAVAQAQASLAQAQAQLADLQVGKRPEEIAALKAQVDMAKAQADDARRKYARAADLFKRGTGTQADYDTASATLETANAQVGQAEANLAVGGLPARAETIKAADNQVKQAQAELEQAVWRLSKRTLAAPSPGRVNDVIRNPGDTAGPTAPVISVLPDGAVKLSVYIPEAAFSSVKVGSLLSVHCDGCGPDVRARVSYISPDPEFTPPVIYSLENRQKLVYLVEARPEGDAGPLQPGQIVDVDLADMRK